MTRATCSRCVLKSVLIFAIDPSFQILHALHSMERFLDEMMKRSAVFDVVFWHGQCLLFIPSLLICRSWALFSCSRHTRTSLFVSADLEWLHSSDLRHGTLNTGSPEFVSTSRALARQLLFAHLVQHAEKMGLNVFAFSGLEDPEWDKYRRKTRVSTYIAMRTLLISDFAS